MTWKWTVSSVTARGLGVARESGGEGVAGSAAPRTSRRAALSSPRPAHTPAASALRLHSPALAQGRACHHGCAPPNTLALHLHPLHPSRFPLFSSHSGTPCQCLDPHPDTHHSQARRSHLAIMIRLGGIASAPLSPFRLPSSGPETRARPLAAPRGAAAAASRDSDSERRRLGDRGLVSATLLRLSTAVADHSKRGDAQAVSLRARGMHHD